MSFLKTSKIAKNTERRITTSTNFVIELSEQEVAQDAGGVWHITEFYPREAYRNSLLTASRPTEAARQEYLATIDPNGVNCVDYIAPVVNELVKYYSSLFMAAPCLCKDRTCDTQGWSGGRNTVPNPQAGARETLINGDGGIARIANMRFTHQDIEAEIENLGRFIVDRFFPMPAGSPVPGAVPRSGSYGSMTPGGGRPGATGQYVTPIEILERVGARLNAKLAQLPPTQKLTSPDMELLNALHRARFYSQLVAATGGASYQVDRMRLLSALESIAALKPYLAQPIHFVQAEIRSLRDLDIMKSVVESAAMVAPLLDMSVARIPYATNWRAEAQSGRWTVGGCLRWEQVTYAFTNNMTYAVSQQTTTRVPLNRMEIGDELVNVMYPVASDPRNTTPGFYRTNGSLTDVGRSISIPTYNLEVTDTLGQHETQDCAFNLARDVIDLRLTGRELNNGGVLDVVTDYETCECLALKGSLLKSAGLIELRTIEPGYAVNILSKDVIMDAGSIMRDDFLVDLSYSVKPGDIAAFGPWLIG